jgi:hypothetical protein
MITFTHDTTRYTVKPENAQAIRALAAKPPKLKIKIDAKHNSMKRDYPEFYAGMETGEYLSRYASLNNRLLLSPWKFEHADRPAPMLDAAAPEVLEEENPDYVPEAPKARKLTATAQLKARIEDLENVLADMLAQFQYGASEYDQQIINAARKVLEQK